MGGSVGVAMDDLTRLTELERLTERLQRFHGQVRVPNPRTGAEYVGYRSCVQSVYRAKWRVQRVLPLIERIRVAAAGRKLTLGELAAAANRRGGRTYKGKPWTAASLGAELRSK